jgi:guanylate kinase
VRRRDRGIRSGRRGGAAGPDPDPVVPLRRRQDDADAHRGPAPACRAVDLGDDPARRPSEIEGVHYRFVPVEEFTALRDRGELLEWAEVHGNFYGTPRRPVEAALASGADMIFDIDWQGTRQVVEKMRGDVVTVFVLPPSFRELKQRLERRAEDSAETIAQRLRNARGEIARWTEYDYVLVNDDLDRTFADVTAILRAERLRRERATGVDAFVDGLLSEGL